MELKNVDFESSTVNGSFAGMDKMERIVEKLHVIMTTTMKGDKDIVKAIVTAVELYADTTEEAIGIALSMHHAWLRAGDDAQSSRNPMESLFDKIFNDLSNKMSEDFPGIPSSFGGGIGGGRGMSDSEAKAILGTMPNSACKSLMDEYMDCKTCSKTEDCEILKEARERGVR